MIDTNKIKEKFGTKNKKLNEQEKEYVTQKVLLGWTPYVIVGRGEIKLPMSSRTLYRRFILKPN